MKYQAVVFRGRLMLCEPTDLPEGAVIELETLEPIRRRQASLSDSYYELFEDPVPPSKINQTERFQRNPDGNINNCSLAFGLEAEGCQICGGECPDKERLKRP